MRGTRNLEAAKRLAEYVQSVYSRIRDFDLILQEQQQAIPWGGALHDVPLQWPALVAGLIDAAVEQASREGE